MIDLMLDAALGMLCILLICVIATAIISIPFCLWKFYKFSCRDPPVLPVYRQEEEKKPTLKERITSLVGMKRSASAEYILNTLDVSFEVNLKNEVRKLLKLVITKITTASPKTWTGNTDHEDGEFDKLFIDTQLSYTQEFINTSITNKNENETKYELVCYYFYND